jgi:hypothetical protein
MQSASGGVWRHNRCFAQPPQRIHESHTLLGNLVALGIFGGLGEGLTRLFMSNPALEVRISALQHL